jgi:hypothetical protein
MVEVVVVVVHLRRRELTLVHDVLGRKRADKEALGEGSASSGVREHSVANLGETADSHFVGDMLPEHVELALEALDVEGPILGGSAVAIVLAVDDERLEDRGLLGARRGAEDSAVRGDLAPAEDPKAVVDRSLGEDGLLLAELDRVVRLEEDVPDGVLARRGVPVMTPAPSPSRESAPVAPRWVIAHRSWRASDTILWEGAPLIWQMKPTPQASFSYSFSYRPWLAGSAPAHESGSRWTFANEAISSEVWCSATRGSSLAMSRCIGAVGGGG